MIYTAMPGSVILKVTEQSKVEQLESGIVMVSKADTASTEVAEVLSVGDVRDDLKAGTKILFPTSTGLKISKGIFYLKYEDICAIIED